MRIGLYFLWVFLLLPSVLSAGGRLVLPRANIGPVGAGAAGAPATVRLNTLVLNSLSLSNLTSLPAPKLAAPTDGPIATPVQFRDLVEKQASMRVDAVVKRLARGQAQTAVAKDAAPVRLSLSDSPLGGLSEAKPQAADPEVLAALDDKTSVDVQELSDAVNDVMSGFTPAQVGAMSDEDFSDGAERIMAALSESIRARRSPLIAPERGNPSPQRTAEFIKEISPGIQRMANKAFEMDPAEPKTCEACGPVSLAVRGPLRAALRRKFPDADIDVILEPGALLEPGAATPHVFLRIVRRTGPLRIESLAIADFTAAQKPANVKALGLRPGETVVLPWEGASSEDPWTPQVYKRYPIGQFSGKGSADTVARVEAARGSRSRDLEKSLSAFLTP